MYAHTADHGAIYAETFPASLDAAGPEIRAWFDEPEALSVLSTFAGAWGSLGRDAEGWRYTYRATAAGVVARFRAVELAPGQIVVIDVAGVTVGG